MIKSTHQYMFSPQVVGNYLNQSHRVSIETLLLFRVIVFLYLTLVLFEITIISATFTFSFLFLTMWGAYSTYAYFFFAIIENYSFHKNEKSQFFHSALWQVTQMMFMIAFCMEIPVFLMFWGYIYPQITLDTWDDWLFNINLHGVFCLAILFDQFLNDIPLITKHLPVLIIVCLFYAITNATFVFTTNQEIYPGINWKNAITYISMALTLIICLLTFTSGFYYYKKVKKPLIKYGGNDGYIHSISLH